MHFFFQYLKMMVPFKIIRLDCVFTWSGEKSFAEENTKHNNNNKTISMHLDQVYLRVWHSLCFCEWNVVASCTVCACECFLNRPQTHAIEQ